MILFDRCTIPDVSIAVYIKYSAEDKTLFCLVVWAGDLMHQCFWNSQPSYIFIKMGPLTTHQHCLTFSCSTKGSQLLYNVTSPSMHSNHCKTKKMTYQKIILDRDIAIWSFLSVLIWKQNVHLILLSIANNVIYFKFLFLGSVLPCKFIWDLPYCRGMICYLHFRRHIRFTNYNFHTHVVYCITIYYNICCIDK